MKINYNSFLLMLIFSVYFLSCKKDKKEVEKVNVMIVNATPDSPSLDILMNDKIQNSVPLAYPNTTGYFEIINETYTLKVNQTGTSNTYATTIISPTIPKIYSIFAVDSLSKMKIIYMQDDLTAPPSGKAKVRFIHLVANSPAVDIAYAGGAVIAGDYSFMDATGFMEFNAGTYNFEIREAGTSNVWDTWPAITFDDGKIYTVFGKGFVGGSGTQATGVAVISNN